MKSLIKNSIILALLLTAVLLSSCDKGATQGDCGTVSTSTSDCVGTTTTNLDVTVFDMTFSDSYFYDQVENSWVTIDSSQIKSGTISSTINAIATSLSITKSDALVSAKLAETQKSAGSTSSVNTVPYFKFKATDGVTYLYRYRKYSTSGTMLYEKMSTAKVDSGYGYIFVVNETLDGNLYPSGVPVGTQYKNEITITPQSNKLTGTPKTIQFNTLLTTPNLDSTLSYSTAFQNFTVKNRWDNYINQSTLTANTKLDFVSLVDKTSTINASSLDTRIVFADNFKITVEQQVFFEVPIQYSSFLSSKVITPVRGSSFYMNTITMDSTTDFKHRIFFDDVEATQNSKTYTVSSLSAGKNFNVTLSLNLTANSVYGAANGDPNGKGLLYPLQPLCNLMSGTSYYPWIKDPQVASSTSAGKFHAICHLDLDSEQIINPSNNPSNLALVDTWYKAFNYSPYRSDKNELGNFSGIKQIKVSTTGCYKIQTKDPAMSTWTTKTKGGAACNTSDTSDKTWSYFTAEKVYTIYDDLTQYSSISGLTSVLQSLSAASPTLKSNMKFNGEKLNGNSIRHLY